MVTICLVDIYLLFTSYLLDVNSWLLAVINY